MRIWRLALFDRAIRIIVWSVRICWVMVAIVIWFVINIVAISVTLAGRWRATIRRFTIGMIFIRAITVGTLTIRAISVGTTGKRITGAVTVPLILVRTVWPVIIRIVIGPVEVFGSLWSFLQDGPDWFVFSEWDSDPTMVVVYAGPLSRVHQRFFVGNHVIQLVQLPLLPRQLVIHNYAASGRRA